MGECHDQLAVSVMREESGSDVVHAIYFLFFFFLLFVIFILVKFQIYREIANVVQRTTVNHLIRSSNSVYCT